MAKAAAVVADEVEETPPEPERSVREELQASLAEVNARHESDASSHSDGAPTDRGDGRAANGRFAARETPGRADTTVSDPSTIATPISQAGGTPPAAVQPVPGAVEPPQGWSAAEKAVWSTVPPAAQAAIARREQDFHRKLTEHDEVRTIGNQFMSVANEHAQLIQARGSTPVAIFKEVLGILGRIHTSDPQSRAELFRQLAIQNGVDPRALAGAQPNPGQASPPQPIQLPAPVLQTVQEWNEYKAQQKQEAQERAAAEMQQTTAEIEAFRSDPKHPHFAAVTGLMASIIRGGVTSTLEEAYQLAVKAHPETSKLLEAEAQAAAKAQEDARRKAEAARRKAGSLRGGPGGTPEVTGSKGSVRDDLRAAMESVRGRI